jgi:hypothetical protein
VREWRSVSRIIRDELMKRLATAVPDARRRRPDAVVARRTGAGARRDIVFDKKVRRVKGAAADAVFDATRAISGR